MTLCFRRYRQCRRCGWHRFWYKIPSTERWSLSWWCIQKFGRTNLHVFCRSIKINVYSFCVLLTVTENNVRMYFCSFLSSSPGLLLKWGKLANIMGHYWIYPDSPCWYNLPLILYSSCSSCFSTKPQLLHYWWPEVDGITPPVTSSAIISLSHLHAWIYIIEIAPTFSKLKIQYV